MKGEVKKMVEKKLCFKNVLETAEALRDLFEEKEKRYIFRAEVYDMDSKLWELYSILSNSMHGIDMDIDSVYEFTVDALDSIIDNSDESTELDELRDKVDELADEQADIYTSALTEWLNRADKNVGYLTEVLEEYWSRESSLNGFELLGLAQFKARQEVYEMVLDTIEKLMDKYSCDEDE
ncbi:hypothetical protein DMB44_04210 [Thermoplasma sp. Kam2015]|uniref:hypothetical protein n=1 Tax=Thermoplasma sp. Kam2015 TaxID=2094122 RepID=UPI000D81FE57|nr:hypothetical protein [Thermoplasma sp. Kam2015]PYB68544.1 hypothetical protein DMB44_04210 [Thermoplasma sp. Kam2015]